MTFKFVLLAENKSLVEVSKQKYENVTMTGYIRA